MKKKYYAVLFLDDNTSKIVSDWEECQKLIKRRSHRFKSFTSENEAINWLENGGIYEKKSTSLLLEDGVYFDAGTGRGIGVEVRVTDKDGTSLLDKVLEKDKINNFGNYLTENGSTNNFGELIGLYIALEVAYRLNISKIFGDSKLVIEYWSKGFFNRDNLNEKTIKLIEKTIIKRKKFENLGGTISKISGDINPADLGFHK